MAEPASTASIEFKCTHCHKDISVSARQAGQEIACPHCFTALMVPEPGGELAAPEVQAIESEQVVAPSVVEQVASYHEPKVLESLPEEEVTAAVHAVDQNVVSAPVASTREAGARLAGQARLQARAGISSGNRRGVRTPKKASKLPLIVVTALVVLGVAVFVGMNISRNMSRAKLQKDIEEMAKNAQMALENGEIEEAVKLVSGARGMLKSSAYELDQDKQKEWKTGFEKVDELNKSLGEIDELLKQASKAPSTVKQQLEMKKFNLKDGKNEYKPILNKIVVALEEVEKLERAQMLTALRKELEKAEKTYADGQVEEAVRAADQVQAKMAASEKLLDKDLQARVAKLRRNGERFNEVKAVRGGAGADFPKAAIRLEEMSKSLDPAKPEDKPILAYLERAKREVKEEEARAKRISPEDLDALRTLAGKLRLGDPGIKMGDANQARGVMLEYENEQYWLTLQRDKQDVSLFLEIAGYVFAVNSGLLASHPAIALRELHTLTQGMKEAKVVGGSRWSLIPEAPLPGAHRLAGGKTELFYDGRLYRGDETELDPKPALKVVNEAAQELEKAILADKDTDEEIRKVAATVARGAHTDLDKNDYLSTDFCRRALHDRYIESNTPSLGERLKPQLEKYHKAFQGLSAHRRTYLGAADTGDEAEERITAAGHTLFRIYDKARDVTAFGIEHPAEDRPLLFLVQEYKGKLDAFPPGQMPLTVKMTHPAVGVIATCDVAAGKLSYEAEPWALAAALTVSPRLPSYLGKPHWAFPPHVAILDEWGSAKAIVTPSGRVDFPHFTQIADMKERRAAQDKFIEHIAKVCNSTGYLNLYYIYFHQYTLDSPVTSSKSLLGSHTHCGDIHQTIYESLDRELAGRHLGDCDDLAELFQVITERQGKLSFVMALPSHAACGWVDQAPAGGFVMQFLQTGPPLVIEGNELDKVVEAGSRLHDHERNMHFDPKSLGFLFRFAGEPTRTPYWLSTRMFVDKAYAETMERVQGYWHFHFYALGIQTMEEMIAKGDRVPENCTELSGLYGQVRETEKAIKWVKEALKQLGPEDLLTRSSETMRMAQNLKRDNDDQAAHETLKEVYAELKRLTQVNDPRQYMRYISPRQEIAGILNGIQQPWEAFDLVERDALIFKQQPRGVPFSHGPLLTSIFEKMLEQEKGGRSLSPAEQSMKSRLEKLLEWYFSSKLFQPDDDFNDVMRKYGTLGRYYSATMGKDKYLQEVLKDGPWPEAERDHAAGATKNAEEDWKWIRMSLVSHLMQLGDALDPEEPPEKCRKDEAVKLAEAMERAAQHAKKFGSLAGMEFKLYTTRIVHSFLTKNWKEFEEVMKIVKEKNWARLTSDVSETMGECARFVTPQEFHEQYKLFCRYVDTKAPYFTVVYEAYRAEGYEHARLAAHEAVRRWPTDEDMKREAKYLDELTKNRLEDKKKKPAPKK